MGNATKKQTRGAIESIRDTVANRLGLNDPTFVAIDEECSCSVSGSRMDWIGHLRYRAKPLENAEFGMIDQGQKATVNEGDESILLDFEATWEDGDFDAVCALEVQGETVFRIHNRNRPVESMMDEVESSLETALGETPDEAVHAVVVPVDDEQDAQALAEDINGQRCSYTRTKEGLPELVVEIVNQRGARTLAGKLKDRCGEDVYLTRYDEPQSEQLQELRDSDSDEPATTVSPSSPS